MNERIQKLAEQAVVAVDIVTGNEVLDDELAKMYIPDCFSEKFAQLIVRECIVDFYRRYLDVTSNEDITVQVERYVKEHFRVE